MCVFFSLIHNNNQRKNNAYHKNLQFLACNLNLIQTISINFPPLKLNLNKNLNIPLFVFVLQFKYFVPLLINYLSIGSSKILIKN